MQALIHKLEFLGSLASLAPLARFAHIIVHFAYNLSEIDHGRKEGMAHYIATSQLKAGYDVLAVQVPVPTYSTQLKAGMWHIRSHILYRYNLLTTILNTVWVTFAYFDLLVAI